MSIPSQSMEGLGSVEAVVLAGNTDGQAAAIPLREYGKTITPDTWNANSCSEEQATRSLQDPQPPIISNAEKLVLSLSDQKISTSTH